MAVWTSILLSDIRSSFRLDSEFYKKNYLEQDRRLSKLKCVPLGFLAKITDGEHGSVKFVCNGVKYLTAENIKQGYVDFDYIRYVGSEVDQRNARARVNTGDVLISIKGTLGEIGVAEDQLLPANMNRDVAIIKPFSSSSFGYFIAAFLRSFYGKYQLAREGSGGVQQMITLERLKKIIIPLLPEEDVRSVINIYKQAFVKRQASIASYAQAKQLLESELGLDKFHFDKPVGYAARFSELEQSRRTDAEFFNPELRYFQQEIAKYYPLRPITDFVTILKFANPPYSDEGLPIITQKHLGNISPEYYGKDLFTHDSWVKTNPNATIRVSDLLYYSVGAYLGKTNIWLANEKAVHASFITMLRCYDPEEAAYLHILLNSKYGLLQSKCFQSGTSQSYIYPKDIKCFLIPVVPQSLRRRIHKLVIESYYIGEKSKQLLDQAKSRVEQLIEEAVRE